MAHLIYIYHGPFISTGLCDVFEFQSTALQTAVNLFKH